MFTISIVILILFIRHLDLFSRYNFITGYFDLYTTGLIYPQCEFDSENLRELNSISTEMGFKVIHIDCDLFYTKGLNQYYEIMSSRIEAKNGQDWIDDLYQKRRN